MGDRHHGKRTDMGLRLGGAALWGLAWLAVSELAALPHVTAASPPSIWAAIFAATAFLSASLGAILVSQGHHIFDRIEIGERWQSEPRPETKG